MNNYRVIFTLNKKTLSLSNYIQFTAVDDNYRRLNTHIPHSNYTTYDRQYVNTLLNKWKSFIITIATTATLYGP